MNLSWWLTDILEHLMFSTTTQAPMTPTIVWISPILIAKLPSEIQFLLIQDTLSNPSIQTLIKLEATPPITPKDPMIQEDTRITKSNHMTTNTIFTVLLMSLGTDAVKLELVELSPAMNALQEEVPKLTGNDLEKKSISHYFFQSKMNCNFIPKFFVIMCIQIIGMSII